MYILFCIYIHTYMYTCVHMFIHVYYIIIYIYVNGIPILNHPTHSRCIRQETLQAQPPPGAVPPRNRCAATWRRPKQRCLALQREWGLGPEDDRWVKRIKYDDIIYIYTVYYTYINQIPEKNGSSYQNLVFSQFLYGGFG